MASSKKRSREDVELGGDIDALFTTPLRDFTRARDELAKSLRKSGDRARATQVAATRRPSVAAWTLNQLARRYPQRMDSLLEAGERLREAQRGALEPGGAKGLREASQAHRALVNELLRAAPSLLEEAGYRAAGGNMDRVRDSLLAAPTARKEDLERLERGQLTQEIEPGDLTDVLGMMRGQPTARPQEEVKARADEGGGKAKKTAPAKPPEAPSKVEKPKRKVAEPRSVKTPKVADREEKKRVAAQEREEKKRRAAQDREEAKRLTARQREAKKRLAAEQREEKKRLAAEQREEKKRLAAQDREEKKRLAEARRERDQAGREAAAAAKEAERRTREAERLMRAAEEAAEAAKTAMKLAQGAEREAREAQEEAAEAARRLDAAERALDK